MQPSTIVTEAISDLQSSEVTPASAAASLLVTARHLTEEPEGSQDLIDALFLYDAAADFLVDDPVRWARTRAEKGRKLLHMPGFDLESLPAVADLLDESLRILRFRGSREEVRDIELELGLCLMGLAAIGRIEWDRVVGCYRRAIRLLDPNVDQERYALAQNNLATALLQLDVDEVHQKRRMSDVVDCFEAALQATPVEERPRDHALFQANLATTLAAAASEGCVSTRDAALSAFDRALDLLQPPCDDHARVSTLRREAQRLWANRDQERNQATEVS